MINSSHQTLCAKHNQRAVYYNRSESDPQRKYLCQTCIFESNSNLMLMEDVNSEIRQLKVNLQNDRRKDSEKITSYLEDLKQDFYKYKDKVNSQIEKGIIGIHEQLKIVETSQIDFDNMIYKLPENDFNSFIQQYKIFQNSLISGREIKDKIQENITNILNIEQFKQTLQLVQKLGEGLKAIPSEIFETYRNRVSNTISCSQISYSNCTKHQGFVLDMINMNQAINFQNRLVCNRCKEENPSQQYITIRELYDKYVIYEKFNLEMTKNFNEELNQQKLQIQNLLELINRKISNYQTFLKTQELKCQSKLKFDSNIWHTYKAEEIGQIAEIIIQYDQQNQFEQSTSTQFNCCKSKIKEEFDKLLTYIQDLGKNSAKINQSNTQVNQRPQIILNSQFRNGSQQLQLCSQPILTSLSQMAFVRQVEDCWAIEISQNCSTIFASAHNLINVMEFKNYYINQSQTLNNHKGWVTNINLMKKSNQLLSGSNAFEIIIWNQKNNNKWEQLETIQLENIFIKCLIININENLIIFAGSDKKISFYSKNQNQKWNCSQIIQDHNSGVYGLSLNNNQDKLISCGDDKYILISQFYQQPSRWRVVQKIELNTFGYRICFITDNVFSFQPSNQESLHFYEFNQQKNQYEFKTSVQQVDCGKKEPVCFFPQQFIKKKQILVNKNGQFINFIKRQENGHFVLVLSMQFQTDNIYGKVSEDGEYLITWDWSSKSLQVKKLSIQ